MIDDCDDRDRLAAEHYARRRRRDNDTVQTIGTLAIAAIASGLLLWLITGDSRWLLLCLPVFLFLGK